MTLTEADIQYYRERKCVEKGCYYMQAHGTVLCVRHLHGSPQQIPDEVIQILMNEEKAQKNRIKHRKNTDCPKCGLDAVGITAYNYVCANCGYELNNAEAELHTNPKMTQEEMEWFWLLVGH